MGTNAAASGWLLGANACKVYGRVMAISESSHPGGGVGQQLVEVGVGDALVEVK